MNHINPNKLKKLKNLHTKLTMIEASMPKLDPTAVGANSTGSNNPTVKQDKFKFYSASTADFDATAQPGQPKYKEHAKWDKAEDEAFISKIDGIRHMWNGPMAKNSYEFDATFLKHEFNKFDPKKQKYENVVGTTVFRDRFWINDEREIWSTDMADLYGYTINEIQSQTVMIGGQEMNLSDYLCTDKKCLILHSRKNMDMNFKQLSDQDLQNIIGTIEQTPSPYGLEKASMSTQFKFNPVYNAEIDADKRPEWLRMTQNVGDWLGFIPLIGDVVDAINAVIYYIYGQYFDAALSMIAVIPVLGSALKVSVKGAQKVAGKVTSNVVDLFKKGFDAGDLSEALDKLAKTGMIDPKILPEVYEVMSKIGRTAEKSKKYFKDPEYLKAIDKLVELMKNTGRSISAAEQAKIFKTTAEAINKTAKSSTKWKRFVPKMNIVKRHVFWPEKQIKRIAENLNADFFKKMYDYPDQAGVFVHTLNGSARSRAIKNIREQTLQSIVKSGNVKLPTKPVKPVAPDFTKIPANKHSFYKNEYTADIKHYNDVELPKWKTDVDKIIAQNGILPENAIQSTESVQRLLEAAKSSMDPKDYTALLNGIVTNGKQSGSVVWNAYSANELNHLKAYADKKGIFELSNLATQPAKWYDIASNEVQAFGVDTGLSPESEDEPSVFWDMIASGVNASLQAAGIGSGDVVNDIKTNPVFQTVGGISSGLVNTVGRVTGLTDSQTYTVEL